MAEHGGGERLWVLEADPETGMVDQDELEIKMAEAAVVLSTVGGVLQVAPYRQRLQDRPRQFVTTAVIFRWHSYVPAAAPAEQGDNIGPAPAATGDTVGSAPAGNSGPQHPQQVADEPEGEPIAGPEYEPVALEG